MVDLDQPDAGLSRKQERILLLMFRHGELRSREVKELTGYTRGSKNHQLGVLEDHGLIEVVGWDEDAGRDGERIFALTETGQEIVEDNLTDRGERPDEYLLRVERLEDEVDELKTTRDRLENEIDTLREEREEELDKLETGLIRTLQGDKGNWRAELIEEIRDELLDDDGEIRS